jgi:hypothetical protein
VHMHRMCDCGCLEISALRVVHVLHVPENLQIELPY